MDEAHLPVQDGGHALDLVLGGKERLCAGLVARLEGYVLNSLPRKAGADPLLASARTSQ